MLLRLLGVAVVLVFLSGCSAGQDKNEQLQSAGIPLTEIATAAMTGRPTRFDYQSFDAATGRLYVAHMGDGVLTVVDSKSRKVIADVDDVKNVHGVLAVPEMHRVYVSATGTNEVAVIDDQTLKVVARIPAGEYPDGIAFAPKQKKLFVSDEHGAQDIVIDAATNKVLGKIALGGGAGNTQFDSGSAHIFVAVHGINSLVEIDPDTDKIVAKYPLKGCGSSHGLLIDAKSKLAFVACEQNATLVVFDLDKKTQTATFPVGEDPDVLAFDSGLSRLYLAGESGNISVFDERNGTLQPVWSGFYAARAHTVAVDSTTHEVYIPLQNVDGKPQLKILVPRTQ